MSGFTQELWDSGGDPPSETLDWEELTDEQRAAATHIGYTQAIWDGEGDGNEEEATLVPDNGFTESTTNATTAEGEDTPVAASSTTEAPSEETTDPQYWYDYWWNELVRLEGHFCSSIHTQLLTQLTLLLFALVLLLLATDANDHAPSIRS